MQFSSLDLFNLRRMSAYPELNDILIIWIDVARYNNVIRRNGESADVIARAGVDRPLYDAAGCDGRIGLAVHSIARSPIRPAAERAIVGGKARADRRVSQRPGRTRRNSRRHRPDPAARQAG